MDDLHFSQLTHELDIAKHLALGHVFGVRLLDDAGVLFILLGDLNTVLEFHATLVEQQPLEGAGIAIRGIKIRSFFNQHFAHLCVHRRIFRLIEGFFENQNNHTLKNSRGIESDVQDIIDQLIELFWGQLVEYTAHLFKMFLILWIWNLSKDAISMNRAEFGKVIVMLSTRGRSVEVIGIHWRSRIVCDMLVISWLAVVTKSIVEIRAGAC